LLAEGYEFERLGLKSTVNARSAERVLVVRSESYRRVQQQGLESRLQRATEELLALTPKPGRGKRQFRDESELIKAAEAILKVHAVEGVLNYTYERQENGARSVGRGRSGPERPQQEIVTVRSCRSKPWAAWDWGLFGAGCWECTAAL
jgi:transposase